MSEGEERLLSLVASLPYSEKLALNRHKHKSVSDTVLRSGSPGARPLTSALVSEPIRVLRVIARLNMGGPAIHVANLAAGLQTRGYQTTLVAGSLARGEDSMAFLAERLGVSVVSVPEIQREVSALHDLRSAVRLASLIRTERPHVLHTHTAKAGAIARAAAMLAGDARPPVVVHTFHGHVLKGYFGPGRTAFFRRVEQTLARTADVLVAVSPEVRDELVELGIAPREKFAVIRLGIPLEERLGDPTADADYRGAYGIPADSFVVGWVGRMTGVKDTGAVLDIVGAAREQGVNAVLCMVGDGPDRVRLEQRAHDLGIARSCYFVGYQEDVAGYYRLFDAFLLPSVNEGTPVSAIEALASGTPVVANRVGGVPDVVRDGVDGFLVEQGDVVAAGQRIAALARDARLRKKLGGAGRARVLERYAVSRLVDDVDRLYRALLDAKGVRD
jgi:glycosyltransferase involved in cell wall biosynthesis